MVRVRSGIGRRHRRSVPGVAVVLCGCGRAQVLDLRARRAQLAAAMATAATVTLIVSGEALVVIAAGVLLAVAAIAIEISVGREAAAIARAGYCQRCTTTPEHIDPGQLGGQPNHGQPPTTARIRR